MHKGYIKLYRKFWDNPISHKPNYLAVFLYILSKANHTDKELIIKNETKIVKRGQYFGSMKQIAEQFKMQRSTVKYIFDYFLKESVISVQEKNTNFTFVTINNYDDYQKFVQEYNADNTGIHTTNNIKHVKQEKKKETIHGNFSHNSKFILKYLNDVINRNYRDIKFLYLIEDLLNKDYSKEELIMVIDFRVWQSSQHNGWPDYENEIGYPMDFIKPTTLFNPSKFDEALNLAKEKVISE